MGGLKIQNNNKNDAGYITGSFSAFLPGGDIFQTFILVMAIIIVILGVSALRRKKKSSEKINKRVSSLRREFNSVKEETNNSKDNWIKMRLNGDDHDLEDMILVNKK